jgi:5'-3' exoribonuclease 2
MAIDGVAPRAKMNQQRARRFKGAKEAVDLQLRKEELLKDFTEKNEINDDILAFV